MLTELNDLGVHVRRNKKDFVPRFVTEEGIYKVISILLKKEISGGYSYERISVEDYSLDDKRPYKYYYFRGSSNGPNITLASLVTDPAKTLEKKIAGWLIKHDKNSEIKAIKNCYDKDKEKILKEVTEKYNEVKVSLKSSRQKGNILLDFKIDEGKEILYPLEISTFRNLLDQDLNDEYCSDSHGNSVCYLCKNKKEVCGNVLPALGLKFSTMDKPGFTPGLLQSQFWKSVPICMDCAENVKFGYSYILNYLDFPRATRNIAKNDPDRSLGFRLMVIPSSINEGHLKEFLISLEKLKGNGRKGLITSEDGLISLYYEQSTIPMSDSFVLSFLFYRKDNSKFQILRYLAEVLPSRLWTVEKIQQDTLKNQGTEELWFLGEDAMHTLFNKNFTGNFIGGTDGNNKFFPTSNWFILLLHKFYSYKVRDKSFLNDRFFEILDAALGGQSRINFDLIPDYMRKIRKNVGKNYYALALDVIGSLLISYILRELGIISGEHKMVEITDEKKSFDMGAFFKKLTLETDEEKSAVAVGALVSKVLYVQRNQRKVGKGKEPFWSKLNDLLIDHDRLRIIYRESIAKLRQYQADFSSIEESASDYLARTDHSASLSKEKTSYYFTVGLILGDTLWPEKKEERKMEIAGDENE